MFYLSIYLIILLVEVIYGSEIISIARSTGSVLLEVIEILEEDLEISFDNTRYSADSFLSTKSKYSKPGDKGLTGLIKTVKELSGST